MPIRVELQPLTKQDFVRILKEPDNSLIKQYVALMKTENVELQFTDDGIEELASSSIPSSVNCSSTFSVFIKATYCLIKLLSGSLSILTKSCFVSGCSSTRIGNLP